MPQGRTGISTLVTPGIALVAILLSWQGYGALSGVSKIVLPTPVEVARAIVGNPWLLMRETGVTMLESVLGFLLGAGTAFLMAIAFVHSKAVREGLYPYAVAIKSTPLIAIAPILILWFGNGLLSKVVMSALVAFFPVLVNAVRGLISVDPEALDLMKSLSATKLQVLTKIRFPNSLSYLFASLKIASSLAVVGAVIGEFTGSTEGIGHLINTASYYLQTPLMFAGVLMISLGGILFFGAVAYLEKRIVFWEDPA